MSTDKYFSEEHKEYIGYIQDCHDNIRNLYRRILASNNVLRTALENAKLAEAEYDKEQPENALALLKHESKLEFYETALRNLLVEESANKSTQKIEDINKDINDVDKETPVESTPEYSLGRET